MSARLPDAATALADARGRRKRKLRLSLTDRCNFRCAYCMPEQPRWLPRQDLLRQEELLRLTQILFADMGMTELRLTGGEPLLRRNVVELVAALDRLRPAGLERLAMTTNASRLAHLAQPLADAGLDDLNISLDAIDAPRFRALTGGDLGPVLAGIDAARAAGLPLKLNCVAIRDYNEDQILPLTRWAMARGLPLRFIEFMPLDGRRGWRRERVVTQDEILSRLGREFDISPQPRGSDPATPFLLDGHYPLGIIATVSRPFCRSCDRLRLTSTGGLYNCLFSERALDLRAPLRRGQDDAALGRRIRAHVWGKEAGYIARPGYAERPLTMHHLGG